MEVRAVAKDTGISAQKIRLLVDMVRGKRVDDALIMLKFAASPLARVVAKAVKSAAANAENNFQMTPADLKIVNIYADEARSMKRFRPRAKGRASQIIKRSSHITVIVDEQGV
ncbi:MAG: 50S ribosomal protein L22 [Dehalococcoidales bacterium]|nr:50S ribosomal protein L22 [Dehalococcoidales bacterium]